MEFIINGLNCAQDLENSEWEIRFRSALSILHLRNGKPQDAEESLKSSSRPVRKHQALKDLNKLISEIKKKGSPKSSTRERVHQSMNKILAVQPIDWYTYDWANYFFR